jgi:sigma-E factor negative regulatory protein RseA
VSRAVDQETMPGKVWRPVAEWLKPVAGGAIAAGVAAVALVSLRTQPVEGPVGVAAAVTAPASTAAPLVAATTKPEPLPSDTVPAGGNFAAPPLQIINNGRLANFVVAHSEYSSPLGRRNVLTGLLTEEAAAEQAVPAAANQINQVSTGDSPTR